MSVWDFQLLTKKSRTYSSCEVISSNLKNWHLFDAAFLRAGAAFARSPAQRILRLSTFYIAHKEDSKVFQFEKKTFFVFFHLPSILPMSMMTISWVLWTVETLPKTPPLRDLVWNPVQFLISNLFLPPPHDKLGSFRHLIFVFSKPLVRGLVLNLTAAADAPVWMWRHAVAVGREVIHRGERSSSQTFYLL